VVLEDSLLWAGKPFGVVVELGNAGNVDVSGVDLSFRGIQRGIQHFEQQMSVPEMIPGDTISIEVELTLEVSGWVQLMAELVTQTQDMSADLQVERSVFLSSNETPLVINEVMCLPALGGGEWVEIYNLGTKRVDLDGWCIKDRSDKLVMLSDSSLLMDSQSYLVVGDDLNGLSQPFQATFLELSNFPTLNNTEDGVTLFDPQGIEMDAMDYSASTELVEGRSLERIRPQNSGVLSENWSVCIHEDGSTPGRRNSLFLDQLAEKLEITLDPNPFSPNGDGRGDELRINYELPFEFGLMSITVFDMAGRKIAEPVNLQAVSHRGQVVWDGEATYGGKAVTGLYIMKLLFDDRSGRVWHALRKVYLIR